MAETVGDVIKGYKAQIENLRKFDFAPADSKEGRTLKGLELRLNYIEKQYGSSTKLSALHPELRENLMHTTDFLNYLGQISMLKASTRGSKIEENLLNKVKGVTEFRASEKAQQLLRKNETGGTMHLEKVVQTPQGKIAYISFKETPEQIQSSAERELQWKIKEGESNLQRSQAEMKKRRKFFGFWHSHPQYPAKKTDKPRMFNATRDSTVMSAPDAVRLVELNTPGAVISRTESGSMEGRMHFPSEKVAQKTNLSLQTNKVSLNLFSTGIKFVPHSEFENAVRARKLRAIKPPAFAPRGKGARRGR